MPQRTASRNLRITRNRIASTAVVLCAGLVSSDRRSLTANVAHAQHLILVAFITGNSSLEPLIEGLYAQIHVNLR